VIAFVGWAMTDGSSDRVRILGLSLVAPHQVRRPQANIARKTLQVFDKDLMHHAPRSVAELIDVVLAHTGPRLNFGLSHKTRLNFDEMPREANCVEYSQLFAALFNRGAKQRKLHARAYVINSRARMFGFTIPLNDFHDHDWVWVTERRSSRNWSIDPALHDAYLGWDIASQVEERVIVP